MGALIAREDKTIATFQTGKRLENKFKSCFVYIHYWGKLRLPARLSAALKVLGSSQLDGNSRNNLEIISCLKRRLLLFPKTKPFSGALFWSLGKILVCGEIYKCWGVFFLHFNIYFKTRLF